MRFGFGSPLLKSPVGKKSLLPRLAVCVALAAAPAEAQTAADYKIDTIAGPGDLSGGSVTTAVRLNTPRGVAVDGAGNVYIADNLNSRIRRVDAHGNIATVAGTGTRGFSGDGGPATAAQLFSPHGVAADRAGNLYIADRNNSRIRRVDAHGNISTVAGTEKDGFSGDGGPATAARLSFPLDVAVDGAGNLYIADTGNDRIRRVDAHGNISTVAGAGEGFSGDGGPATAARLYLPYGVAVDGASNLYIADTGNQRIRRVDAHGNIATVAGTGTRGFSGDGGPATAAQLFFPHSVAVDGAGNLYIADTDNHRIRRVDAHGNIATVAGAEAFGFGGDGGPATAAQLWQPESVAVDAAGNLYIADTENHRIRRVDAHGNISTFAGTETHGFSGDGGPATAARLDFPYGVAVDGAHNLYIADTFNSRIRRVDAHGDIATVAGGGNPVDGVGDGGPATAARLRFPRGVAADGAGNLYIADTDNHRIRRVDAHGNIATVAGTETHGFSGDGGPATAARLSAPWGVAVDGAGNLYIADRDNRRIRRVAADGNIATFAGGGNPADQVGDDGPATAAGLSPVGVAVDGAGNVYIVDAGNDGIRRVGADGNIATVAGGGNPAGGIGDGGPATAARLSTPHGVAVDGAGNLYIADTHNQFIRKVDAHGNIATIAGAGTIGYGGDGGPATAAYLNLPRSVAVDGAGNVYIADTHNHRIRRLRPTPRISAGGIVLATGTPLVDRISPNALISVFGQDFASQGAGTLSPQLDAAGRVGVKLAGSCLEIGGKRAPLFMVAPNQINAQAPHDLTPVQAQAAIVRDCGADAELRGPETPVEIGAVSPAFFNVLNNPDGRNPLVAQHGGGPALAGAPSLGAAFTPAEPGELVTLFGTGFGAVEPPLATGQIPGAAANLANAGAFTVGGVAVPAEDVIYAGASPCCAGLYQFTLRLPADLPDGDAPIVAAVNGVSTPQGPFLTVRRRQ